MKALISISLTAALLFPSCQSSGAAEGATRGAFYGAVSSGVVAAVFGGDVGKSMQYGAVGGAVTGGMAGAASDSRQQQQQAQQAQQQQLKQQNEQLTKENRALQLREDLIAMIGVQNTEAISSLVNCRHEEALTHVRRAATSDDRDHRLASLWVQAMIEVDRRDLEAARVIYPTIVAQDDKIDSETAAEKQALDLVTSLEDTRAEFGLPRRCQ